MTAIISSRTDAPTCAVEPTPILLYPSTTDRETWLSERHKFIGSSEIASILNLSPFKSSLALWLEKKNKSQTQETDAMFLGSALEPVVLKFFNHKTRSNAVIWGDTFTRSDIPFAIATPDARLEDGSILEIKTTSAFNGKNWDSVPLFYEAQTQWQMGIMCQKSCKLAVLIGGSELKVFDIDFKENVFDLMIKEASKFYDSLTESSPPAFLDHKPCDFKVLANSFNDSDGSITLSDEHLATMYLDLQDEIRDNKKIVADLEAELELLKVDILRQMKGHKTAKIGDFTAILKTTTRKAFEVKESIVNSFKIVRSE